MPKYRVYAVVAATKFIGEFLADNKEQAEAAAWDSDDAYISVCHHCSNEVDGADIETMVVEEIEDVEEE